MHTHGHSLANYSGTAAGQVPAGRKQQDVNRCRSEADDDAESEQRLMRMRL